MYGLDPWLVALGGIALLVSLLVGFLRSGPYPVTYPMIAVAAGMLLGQPGFAMLELSPIRSDMVVLELMARLTVAVAVTSIALRLDPGYYKRRARALLIILGPVLVLMWVTSGVLAWLVLPVSLVPAFLIGAILAPTDPVLANSIVTGTAAKRYIPERLRRLLSAEAGINDGAAAPFVAFMLLLYAGTGRGAASFIGNVLVRELIGGALIGLAIGFAVGSIERRESAADFLETMSVMSLTLALTALVLGVASLLETNDILAVFVAAVAYNHAADPQDEQEEQQVQELFNRLLTIPALFAVGFLAPIAAWRAIGWPLAVFAMGVLLFRRLPAILALSGVIDPLDRPSAAVFVGWFGPIGIAAIYYALEIVRTAEFPMAWPVASFVVVASVFVHGTTTTPAMHWYRSRT